MEEIYGFFTFVREAVFILWLSSTVWIAFSHKKIYRHINNSAYLKRFDWLIKARRRSLLAMTFLPPFTPFNLVFILLWYTEWSDVKRYRWDLVYLRTVLRDFEKDVLLKNGIDGLIKAQEKIISDLGDHLKKMDTGTREYDLCTNLYIKCQRRLLKMKQGKGYGHFPIPK